MHSTEVPHPSGMCMYPAATLKLITLGGMSDAPDKGPFLKVFIDPHLHSPEGMVSRPCMYSQARVYWQR